MNIYTVRDNLRNTIAGKEKYLAGLREGLKEELSEGAFMAVVTTTQMLDINIDELKRILADVEVCCEQHNEMGWMINPERMGQ